MAVWKAHCIYIASAQARQDDTLDIQVPSLQARRLLLHSLDLIPPQFSRAAAAPAAPVSLQDGSSLPEGGRPGVQPPAKKRRHPSAEQPAAGSQLANKKRKQSRPEISTVSYCFGGESGCDDGCLQAASLPRYGEASAAGDILHAQQCS
jgi:hypothetical protein